MSSISQSEKETILESLKDNKSKSYIDIVFNAAFAEIMGNLEKANIDPESYEEVRTVAIELES